MPKGKNMRARVGQLPSILFAAAIGLSGCTITPSEGPSTSDLTNVEAPFVFIEAEETVAEAFSKRRPEPISAVFERDGRGATETIASGDIVSVTIYETVSNDLVSSLFNGNVLPPQRVTAAGTISVPFVGPVRVMGRNAETVSREIANRLSEKTIDPSVLVSIEKRLSNAVSVVGDAGVGGLITLEPGADRLMDAISRNGGVTVPVHEAIIALTRDDVTVRMPLDEVLKDPSNNVTLNPGDLIAVTHEPKTFVASGANGESSLLNFKEGVTTLAEGLALAGGLLDQQADPAGVFVLRYEAAEFLRSDLGKTPPAAAPQSGPVPVVYRFNFREPGDLFLSQQFLLEDDDIVYVSNALSVQIQKFVDLFRVALSTGATVNGLSR